MKVDAASYALNTVPACHRRGRRDGAGIKIVVIGGGLAGLLSGFLLVRRGHTVTVIERDGPPPNAESDAAFESWASAPGLDPANGPLA
jgi:glycine/D-amino acid oxidase-like deaminating enzyme